MDHKRILSLLLAAVLCLSIVPVSLAAEEDPAAETTDELVQPAVAEESETEDMLFPDQADASSDSDPQDDEITPSEDAADPAEEDADSVSDEELPDSPDVDTSESTEDIPEVSEELSEETGTEPALADEPEDAFTQLIMEEPEAEVTIADAQQADNDELLMAYVEQEVFPSHSGPGMLRAARRTSGSRLTGADAIIYSELRSAVSEIAAGDRTSTIISISVEQLGVDGRYTAADLGVDSIVVQTDSGNDFNPEAVAALQNKLVFDQHAILQALMADCPYELFWYDKTASTVIARPGYGAGWDNSRGEWVIYYSPRKGESETSVTFRMPVAEGYAGTASYVYDTSKLDTVRTALTNVRGIVDACSAYSDLEKLVTYRQEVCARVSYNRSAANNLNNTPYGDPWQLIWVFDGDPTTNVVCEGYSKAFKYLCDQSEFYGDISCALVTGTMSGGTGAGNHMWNVVRMDDGKNYLVDVTNCDTGTVGADDRLFLVGYASGSVSGGYTYDTGTSSIRYTYDDDTLALFSEDELTISPEAYREITPLKIITQPSGVTGSAGTTYKVTLTAQGDGLTYQWYCKNKDSSGWWASSIKKDTYSFKMSDTYNGRQIYCVVRDQYGNSLQSETVTLTQRTQLTIITQPVDVYAASGTTARATIAAQGDGLTYQWYCKNKGSTSWWASSVKSAVYTFKMSSAYDGRQVYCIVKDQYGNSLQSETVTLTQRTELKIVTQPVDVYAASGTTARATIAAQGDGLTYQWYCKNKGSTSWWASSVKSAVYTFKMSSTYDGRQVYCVVKDQYGNSVQSETVTLSQHMELMIVAQPVEVYAASGKTAKATITAQGDGLTYQWYCKNKGSTSWWASSVKSAVYSFKMSATYDGRQIYCIVTDKDGNSVQSETITLTMRN